MEPKKHVANHPAAPIDLFQGIFCKNCSRKDNCDIDSPLRRLCVQCLLADELARLRQLIERRSQHLSW